MTHNNDKLNRKAAADVINNIIQQQVLLQSSERKAVFSIASTQRTPGNLYNNHQVWSLK